MKTALTVILLTRHQLDTSPCEYSAEEKMPLHCNSCIVSVFFFNLVPTVQRLLSQPPVEWMSLGQLSDSSVNIVCYYLSRVQWVTPVSLGCIWLSTHQHISKISAANLFLHLASILFSGVNWKFPRVTQSRSAQKFTATDSLTIGITATSQRFHQQ